LQDLQVPQVLERVRADHLQGEGGTGWWGWGGGHRGDTWVSDGQPVMGTFRKASL
jgi:hypothetical protein